MKIDNKHKILNNTKMKKLLTILAISLGIAACSVTDTNSDGTGEYQTNYLSINLVPSPNTRAEYEDGIPSENKVNDVYFFFFDEDGKAASVKADKTNWCKATPDPEDGKDSPNVEKILKATVVIDTKNGDTLPKSVVAVLNVPSGISTSFTEVEDLVKYVNNFSAYQSDDFVMSNSVYAAGTEKKVAVDVEGHLRNTPEAAKASPVNIYVERVLAKATLAMNTNFTPVEGTQIYKIELPRASEDADNRYKTELNGGQDIYVKILGWDVTASTKRSRLVKQINPNWGENMFKTTGVTWNYSPYFRSFWAINPIANDGGAFVYPEDYNYGSFDNVAKKAKMPGTDMVYMQENAADVNTQESANPLHPTQVIIVAQLCKNAQGDPLSVFEYGFELFGKEEDLLTAYANASNVFVVDRSENVQKYSKISKDDLVLKTAVGSGAITGNAWETPGRYYVYAVLKDATKEYSLSNEKGTSSNADDVNKHLLALGSAKAWKDGQTYYFFDIRHLADPTDEVKTTPGYYGVVRNHVYQSIVDGITGLGTPVYNPEETIYPETPKDEYTYIAARINILSWRIVNRHFTFDW